jgi:hypothetical protein
MTLLAAALIFHVTVYRIVARRDRPAAPAKRLTGALMLLLWFGVACAGRASRFSEWT